MKSIDLHVEGMSCASCVRHVNDALTPVAGVAEVSVDLAAGRVRVSGDVDAQALMAALQDAGYPAKLEASAQAPEGGKARGCGGSSCCCH
ncbi:heavy-metal-associated domain-containing protein [Pseudomonas nitroreducens]|uniref:Heavy-metal-associated domain-containing protein n=1 Tax=Pseudomonas nitroreducens TaxID=46680 RepID=A0ABS0KDY0_PSENT|nr:MULTISPECIES: heavy-metal-associated domain-containing protein [Pseudomonas]MBG6286296.1 heavy-metal-associated domain-containing protein [Pseudomonas nitroreducens]MDG9857946.1 heavy-metal-associated domain-containing protein [Pseudomonas nitroreducens]MDH1077015.1 heavy-metal-associated domain-containing protein [Pseudomonas nitroreducens]NNN25465.1 heavy-metal-associated domain-containing protein [Pseudomonas nitroreducens]UCL90203.1 heavy-metal-associated domain-containing protein [Pseu